MATMDQSAHYAELLRRQQIEQDREREERQTIWAFLWVLFAFKAVSVGVLIYWIEWETFLYVVGLTSWPWIIIPALRACWTCFQLRAQTAGTQKTLSAPER